MARIRAVLSFVSNPWPWILVLTGLLAAQGRGAEPKREAVSPELDPAAAEFFEKEVRPLFVERCQQCHGPSKQKGGLRLDSRASILAGGNTGPAIVPGKSKESLLIDAINYGELYQMPPKSKLPAAEIATLTRWVEMGAPWSPHDASATRTAQGLSSIEFAKRTQHWSFRPLQVIDPPRVSKSDWPRTVVDRFILSALEARGLSPAPEADKRTLIRRLTYDLIGLPPTPSEIDAFLADSRADAYERLVERLLAAPHYGEHGDDTGSTSCVMPKQQVTSSISTRWARLGIATTLCGRSMPTYPTTNSSSNRLPATSCHTLAGTRSMASMSRFSGPDSSSSAKERTRRLTSATTRRSTSITRSTSFRRRSSA